MADDHFADRSAVTFGCSGQAYRSWIRSTTVADAAEADRSTASSGLAFDPVPVPDLAVTGFELAAAALEPVPVVAEQPFEPEVELAIGIDGIAPSAPLAEPPSAVVAAGGHSRIDCLAELVG